jgi:hypothetical protein
MPIGRPKLVYQDTSRHHEEKKEMERCSKWKIMGRGGEGRAPIFLDMTPCSVIKVNWCLTEHIPAYCLSCAGFFLCFPFDPEDRSGIFLWNNFWFSPSYTLLHSALHSICWRNLKSNKKKGTWDVTYYKVLVLAYRQMWFRQVPQKTNITQGYKTDFYLHVLKYTHQKTVSDNC